MNVLNRELYSGKWTVFATDAIVRIGQSGKKIMKMGMSVLTVG